MTKIIYIHGLNSSCNSNTAKILESEFGDNFICPKLPLNPRDWPSDLEAFLNTLDPKENYTILGTSTGGFFARYFANKYGYKLVLVNPVVDHNDLKQFIGINENFHTGEKWTLTEDDVDSLGKYDCDSQVSTLLLLGKNDDVLDHEKAINRFNGKSEIVVTDDGHRLDLEANVADIREFMMPRDGSHL